MRESSRGGVPSVLLHVRLPAATPASSVAWLQLPYVLDKSLDLENFSGSHQYSLQTPPALAYGSLMLYPT